MSNPSYSTMLRKLSDDYFQNHIGFEEYRIQRKILLDKIDAEFNGDQTNVKTDDNQGKPVDLMQTVAFYKNSDAEK
jgi:hypothetical protein